MAKATQKMSVGLVHQTTHDQNIIVCDICVVTTQLSAGHIKFIIIIIYEEV